MTCYFFSILFVVFASLDFDSFKFLQKIRIRGVFFRTWRLFISSVIAKLSPSFRVGRVHLNTPSTGNSKAIQSIKNSPNLNFTSIFCVLFGYLQNFEPQLNSLWHLIFETIWKRNLRYEKGSFICQILNQMPFQLRFCCISKDLMFLVGLLPVFLLSVNVDATKHQVTEWNSAGMQKSPPIVTS